MKGDRKLEKGREGVMGELVCCRFFSALCTHLRAQFYEFLIARVIGLEIPAGCHVKARRRVRK